jgi:hypothetical protein
MLLRLSSRRLAVIIALVAVLFAGGARAADTSAGSKNFAAPTNVPNYFSNEAGPLQGPASETQRGPLYMNQAYGTPAAAAAAVARAPQHVAFAEPRGRYVRGRVAYDRHGRQITSRQVVRVHGRPVYRAVAHYSARGHTTHVVAHSAGVTHHTTPVSTHRHARG